MQRRSHHTASLKHPSENIPQTPDPGPYDQEIPISQPASGYGLSLPPSGSDQMCTSLSQTRCHLPAAQWTPVPSQSQGPQRRSCHHCCHSSAGAPPAAASSHRCSLRAISITPSFLSPYFRKPVQVTARQTHCGAATLTPHQRGTDPTAIKCCRTELLTLAGYRP